jgi:hypothetical protein
MIDQHLQNIRLIFFHSLSSLSMNRHGAQPTQRRDCVQQRQAEQVIIASRIPQLLKVEGQRKKTLPTGRVLTGEKFTES